MVAGEDFLLKWNDHHALFFAGAEELVSAEEYTDVTLAAGPRFFAAHRLVLSICSPYFRQLFKRLGGEKAVIFLKDVEPKHLELLLEYMYKGEIKVEETELVNVLNTAQSLEIRGLTDSGQKSDQPTKSKSSSALGSSSLTSSGSKRPAAVTSPPLTSSSSSNHHTESHHVTAAAAPARKRPKPSSSGGQPLVKVKAEEVDLRDDDPDDVIQMGVGGGSAAAAAARVAAPDNNDWTALGAGGSSGGGGAGGTDHTTAVVRPEAVGADTGGGGDPDYGGDDDDDYGGGTVATGYEEMGYEGDDYYTEEGVMQMGEGDDRRSRGYMYPCEICRKCFPSRTRLEKHLVVHTGERNFRCENCGKTYTQSSGLYKHNKKGACLGIT